MKKILVACTIISSTALNFAMNAPVKSPLISAIVSYRLTRDIVEANKTTINDNNNIRQWTPLHYAASFGLKDAIDLLKEYGANEALKDSEEKTAQDLFEEQQKRFLRNSAIPLRKNYHQETTSSEDRQTEQEPISPRPALSIVYNPLSIGNLSTLRKDIETNSPSYASLLR